MLDESLLERFIEEQHFCFKIVLHFYSEFMKRVKYVNQIKLK
jgi:hypothetical protein